MSQEAENKVTVGQVVDFTISGLGRIQVPVDLIDSIGVPIKQAIHNLKVIKEAWNRQAEEAEPEPPVESDEETDETDLHNGNEYGE